MFLPRRGRIAAAAMVVLLAGVALVACQAEVTGPARARPSRTAVVVSSFNFPESDLLAEIYAQALSAAGVPVRRAEGLGPRELVAPALHQGMVDLVPEYLGTALASQVSSRQVDPHDVAAVRAALDGALAGWGLRTLRPAAAENQNGLVVTRSTARRLGLHDVSDLGAVAGALTLGGTPECPSRDYCLRGLRRVYGISFGRFVPFDSEPQRVAALEQGVVDVALMFTTDGHLASRDLVLLRDDRGLQPAENVVPVVSTRALERYGKVLTRTLDRVSAQLTTANLVFLNWRVGVAGGSVAAEARGWLDRHGLLTPAR